MTREWSPDEVETYHQRMQQLYRDRYAYLDPDYYSDPAVDPDYVDQLGLQDARDDSDPSLVPVDVYDPDDREPMGSDPHWREVLEGEEP